MKRTLTLSLLAALFLPLAATATAAPSSVRGFQLPPAPTPTSTPEVQGPIDSDAPIATRPREIVTPDNRAAPAGTVDDTPPAGVTTVSRPVIQPIPQANRTAPQRSTAQRSPSRPASRAASRATPPPSVATRPAATTPAQTATSTPDPAVDASQPDNTIAAPVDAAPSSNIAPGIPAPEAALSDISLRTVPTYIWWLAGVVLLVLLFIIGAVWRRQRAPLAGGVPTIEPPLARTQKRADPALDNAAEPQPVAAETATEAALPLLPIQIKAEAVSLSRSIMNAALSYRFEFMNIGGKDLSELTISADLVSAHGKAPIDEQVAHAGSQLPFVSIIAAIKKGASQEVKGELRLPVGSIRWIAQGSAKLYVPLLRLRVEAEGFEPVVHTFVVGIRPEAKGGKLLPFRLDEMPQTYRVIGFRALT